MLTQAHIYVKGDVTKVGFRGHMYMKAKECSVTGYAQNVYNHPDIFGPHGGVEVVLQGEEESVKDMIDYMKEGSTLSRVDDIEIRFEDPKETFNEFFIKKSESYFHKE